MSYMNKTSMLDEMLDEISPSAAFDLGKDEPGMVLQRRERDGWVDYVVDGEPVIAPIKIDSLPPGKYRLV